MTTGVIIKDPSLPDLRSNFIYDNNMFQVQMEAHAKKKWKQYQTDNPKIIGESVIPKDLFETCNIFPLSHKVKRAFSLLMWQFLVLTKYCNKLNSCLTLSCLGDFNSLKQKFSVRG